MTYVALLRGINVGGNRKVDMKLLKATFERLGLVDVRTYINSGNVIFTTDDDRDGLTERIENAIEKDFGFRVRVIIRSDRELGELVASLPADWRNDDEAKCDVMFLGPEIDEETVLDSLTIKPGIDEVIHVPGAVLWHVERPKVTRSGLLKIVGTELYARMTVRNCNTARKLNELMR